MGFAGRRTVAPQTKRSVVDVNLSGVFYVAPQAAGRMLTGKGGVIINMGSKAFSDLVSLWLAIDFSYSSKKIGD